MSILVVDDNTLLLRKIVRSLMQSEYQVRAASSISEARVMLKQQLPKLMCLDLDLPDGNGLDFLQELRHQGHNFPTLIISGHDSEENRTRAEQLGADDFLAKPFSLESLKSIISSFIDEPSIETEENFSTDMKPVTELIDSNRLSQAKRAFVTRRANFEQINHLIVDNYVPRAGDLVLARVDKLSQHLRLELPTGRRAILHPGDEIIVSYANRYAPDQFESQVPQDLAPCNLVAAGGLASDCLSKNSKMKAASSITPIGVLASADGKALNLKSFKIPTQKSSQNRPVVTAVVGTSMNAGKTTVAADMALGMQREGLRVGAAKVTGTGSGGDTWRLKDAGCEKVYDFTDCGFATTYKISADDCENILETLIAELSQASVDTIIIEVADGVLQRETQQLISSATFKRLVDNVVFAAGDALGAINGIQLLLNKNLNVTAISGAMTASPLACRECSAVVELPVLTRKDLKNSLWMPPGIDLIIEERRQCVSS